MASLTLRPGHYSNFFIVSLDGGPYAVPDEGSDLRLALRGGIPSRYSVGGIDRDSEYAADEEGELLVRRFLPWDLAHNDGGVIQFEGHITEPETMNAAGSLAFDGLTTPPGLLNLLAHEGMNAVRLRQLTTRKSPPLGMLRLW